MFQDEVEIPPLSDKEIVIESTGGEHKSILFLMYSKLPVLYSYNLHTDKCVLKEGISYPHLSLPFLIQYKAPFNGFSINLYIKNLDRERASKFNLLISFLN